MNSSIKTTVVTFLAMIVSAGAFAFSKIQIVHNAADPAAASVDIYVNDALLLDDFAFRTATPFVTVPSGVELKIDVAPPTSTSSAESIATFNVTLEENKKYIAIANGVLDPSSFAPNPDGLSTGFNIYLERWRDKTLSENFVSRVFHGATDAPAVSVLARDVAQVVNDLAYSSSSNIIGVPAANYTIDVTPGADESVIVASFGADASALGGVTAYLIASGFLDPAMNQNGAGFAIIAVLADGTVITLPAVAKAKVQIIHNAADPGAAEVDVYVNGELALDNFAFRAATPFIELPAGTELKIGVADPNSISADEAIANFSVTLTNGQKYIVLAQGVLDPSAFAENPDGISTGFNLYIKDNAKLVADDAGNVEFIAVHGSTDAPTVDVIAENVATLVDDAQYTDITDYIAVPAGAYTLNITPGADNNTVVAAYDADLTGLAGGVATVFASGFLTPDDDQNGAGFTLMAALADGTVIELPAAQLRLAAETGKSFSLFPNVATVTATLESLTAGIAEVVDLSGKKVMTLEVNEGMNTLNVADLSKGLYFVKMNGETGSAQKLIVQ
jgi:hypothetical protein